ncbi:ComEC/Rec2 family competence protein [Bifidobacterium catulorum]|uniref:ComEC/Rec2-related protein domain-containing protein n=1 Tax=Bifidobacterium catulorum TaxID=1630173 RepID=A0A2U2MRH0_9BIFI|nr:ComEC/Rec2 family competence protein [Bifidobacterium catulorum]PWG59458.1 hypothetical protein DF200_07595 [Bifidobacterium catulorum]
MNVRQASGPRAEREKGSVDRRMMPAALAIWATLLAQHALGGRWDAAVMAVTVVCLTGGAVALMLTRGPSSAEPRDIIPRGAGQCLWHTAVLLVAVAAATVSGGLSCLSESHDPVFEFMGSGASGPVAVTAVATTPVMASGRRDADCQTDMLVKTILIRDVAAPSNATIRVFSDDEACRWRQGATYRISGTLKTARFGAVPFWLDVAHADDAVQTSPPSWWRSMATRMQDAFLAQTDRLDDQGRILVPGLTIGVLGQDVHRRTDEGPAPVDDTYARLLEEDFKRSGIMHLMAVSGSHFVLAAELVRRCCARFLAPRRLAAGCIIGAYALLVALVYPSDSVLRAATMGMVCVAGLFLGRRAQSLSSLNWTVIAALLASPATGSRCPARPCTASYCLTPRSPACSGDSCRRRWRAPSR